MLKKRFRIGVFSLFFVLLLTLFSAIVSGCQSASSFDQGGAVDGYEETWNMQAVVVDTDGKVMEQTELSVQLVISNQEDGSKFYNLSFDYPDDIYNSIAGIIPATSDNEPAFSWCVGWGHQKDDAQGLVQTPFYLGLDMDKESFLVDFDDGVDVYLIAYRSESTLPSEIWKYFRGLIDTIPKQFPDISIN